MNDSFFTEDSKREGVITSIIKRLVEVERFVVNHLAMPHYPYPVAARVYNNANISIPDSAVTALTFNTVRRDNGSLYNVANPSRLTAPVDGWYLITGSALFANSAAGSERAGSIRINGTNIAQTDPSFGAAIPPTLNVTTLYYLTAGQYAEYYVYQNSGGALNILASGNYTPEFAMALIK